MEPPDAEHPADAPPPAAPAPAGSAEGGDAEGAATVADMFAEAGARLSAAAWEQHQYILGAIGISADGGAAAPEFELQPAQHAPAPAPNDGEQQQQRPPRASKDGRRREERRRLLASHALEGCPEEEDESEWDVQLLQLAARDRLRRAGAGAGAALQGDAAGGGDGGDGATAVDLVAFGDRPKGDGQDDDDYTDYEDDDEAGAVPWAFPRRRRAAPLAAAAPHKTIADVLSDWWPGGGAPRKPLSLVLAQYALPKGLVDAVETVQTEILDADKPLGQAAVIFVFNAISQLLQDWATQNLDKVVLVFGLYTAITCGLWMLAKRALKRAARCIAVPPAKELLGALWRPWRALRWLRRGGRRECGRWRRPLAAPVAFVCDYLLPTQFFGPYLCAYVVAKVLVKTAVYKHQLAGAKKQAEEAAASGQQPQAEGGQPAAEGEQEEGRRREEGEKGNREKQRRAKGQQQWKVPPPLLPPPPPFIRRRSTLRAGGGGGVLARRLSARQAGGSRREGGGGGQQQPQPQPGPPQPAAAEAPEREERCGTAAPPPGLSGAGIEGPAGGAEGAAAGGPAGGSTPGIRAVPGGIVGSTLSLWEAASVARETLTQALQPPAFLSSALSSLDAPDAAAAAGLDLVAAGASGAAAPEGGEGPGADGADGGAGGVQTEGGGRPGSPPLAAVASRKASHDFSDFLKG